MSVDFRKYITVTMISVYSGSVGKYILLANRNKCTRIVFSMNHCTHTYVIEYMERENLGIRVISSIEMKMSQREFR